MAFDGTLKFDTAIDKTGFELGLSSLGSIAEKGMSALKGAFSTATSAVADLGKFSLGVGREFEAGMSQVAATLGFSVSDISNNAEKEVGGVIIKVGDTMDMLSDKAKAMGASTSFSASQAAEGLNILAMSGYSAEESVGMIENVLHLAEAGSLSLAEAASFAAGSMKGFVSEAGNFADVTEASAYYSDMIAKGATLAATDVTQLGTALSQASASADAYGQSSIETSVALLRLAEQNVTGSNAATALAASMKDIYSPTDSAKKALESLGVSAYDTSGKARDFNTVVDELNSALSSLSDEERADLEDTIFGIQGKSAFDKMVASSSDTVQKFYDGIADASGSAALQSETMLDNLEGRLTIFQSTSEAFGNAIYESFNKPLADIVKSGTGYVEQLTNAFNEDGFEGLAGAVGGVLSDALDEISGYVPQFLDTAVLTVSALADGLSENAPEIIDTVLEIGTQLLDSILNISADILELGAEILIQLVAGITENIPQIIETSKVFISSLIQSIEGLLPMLLDVGLDLIVTLADSIIDSIPELVSTADQIIKYIADFLVDGFPKILSASQKLLSGILSAVPQIIDSILTVLPDIVDTVLQVIPQIIQALTDALPDIIESITDSLPYIIESITDILPDVIYAIIDSIASYDTDFMNTAIKLFSALVDCLPVIQEALLKQIPQIILALLEVLVNSAPQLVGTVFSLLGEIVKIIPEAISQVWELGDEIRENIFKWLSELLTAGWETISQWFSDTFESVAEGASMIVACIIDFLNELPAKIGEIFGFVLGTVAKWAVEAPEKARESAQEFVANVKEFFIHLPSDVADFLEKALKKVTKWGRDLKEKGKKSASDLVESIKNGISSLPSKMADTGKNLVEGLWNGITGAGNWLKNRISDFGNGIIDGFKQAFGIHSPSAVMRDSVGKYLAQGIGVGFTEEMPDVADNAVKSFEKMKVDVSAVQAVEENSFSLNSGLVRPSPTSETVNNTYYNTNTAVAQNGENSGITINAQLVVGEETVAEGIISTTADKIDEHQGMKIHLRKRGLAR